MKSDRLRIPDYESSTARPSPSQCRKIAFGFLEKNRGAIFLARSQRRSRWSEGRGGVGSLAAHERFLSGDAGRVQGPVSKLCRSTSSVGSSTDISLRLSDVRFSFECRYLFARWRCSVSCQEENMRSVAGPRDHFAKKLPSGSVEFLQLHLLDGREVVGAG